MLMAAMPAGTYGWVPRFNGINAQIPLWGGRKDEGVRLGPGLHGIYNDQVVTATCGFCPLATLQAPYKQVNQTASYGAFAR